VNRHLLVTVATIAGLVAIVALLLLPLVTVGTGEHSHSARAIEAESGTFFLLFGWIAAAFAAFVLFRKTDLIGMSESACLLLSLLGFKLLAFFSLARLIAGSGPGRFGMGFWFAFLASVVGALAVYLTFNPALAQRLAAATQAAAKKDGGQGTA
jgi:hypothetical protein